MKKLIIVLLAFTLFGCSNSYRNIPPGYIGKILTEKGWEPGVREAGSVDIGADNGDGAPSKQLVLCEATSVLVKEAFGQNDPNDPGDHRVTTKKIPLSADVRIQVMVPDQQKMRDSIFAQITPRGTDVNRTLTISLEDVYRQFAQGPVRNRIRVIFTKYEDYNDVILHYQEINNQIGLTVAQAFKDSLVPLRLVSAELSNVTPDNVVREASNRQMAADAQAAEIRTVGQAMKDNPQFLEKYKWDVIKEQGGKGMTVIVNSDQGNKIGYTIPVK